MLFDKALGLNYSKACVILANEKAAEAATQALNNAPLFYRRVKVSAYDSGSAMYSKRILTWGWTASKDSNPENVNLRAGCFQRPTNIFQPIREGRRVAFDTVAIYPPITPDVFYKYLHNYNVMCLAPKVLYMRGLVWRQCNFVDFATREEAEEVVHIFNGAKFADFKMEVSKYQIPMRYLGTSWDGGPKGGHRSGRDQGNAVGTNYEFVSLFILALMIGS